LKDSKLELIEINYEIHKAVTTSFTASLSKVARGAYGSDASVATQTFTYDAGHDAAGERVDVDEHKMTLTITTPFWLDNDVYVLVELTCDQAGDTGVIELLGAIANYTLRA
jgi:hypothetical protein